MGFLDRVRNRAQWTNEARQVEPAPDPVVLHGGETLEVVGESYRQDALWELAGGFSADLIRCEATAVLAPEPENPHDPNAIKVLVGGRHVGYLSRADAAVYLPGLRRLMALHGRPIALYGQIVGGGQREDGLGMLGVFLDHDPADFGLSPRQTGHIGELRTGFSEALATDHEDDAYNLSWYGQLSGSRTPADVVVLRKLLASESDPIDRHFMLAELSKCLYKSRDAFASALDEFDAVCVQHDAEMESIRSALFEKFGSIPVIEMYRQAAIRCQKAREWSRMRFWAERGLAVYGSDAARPEAVTDLEKRLAYADAKLAGRTAPRPPGHAARSASASVAAAAPVFETLVCSSCGSGFQRVRSRGRKPHRCPQCREAS